ncbi:MAG: COX15/CtaA family protein [Chloroflexales bacterium]|nr:COX15/CtaA family protein [Chloroflexales bacterium]
MKQRPFAIFVWGSLVFNLIVILWGAFVRISNSGDGCGNHWPLCYGEFIPQTAHTATWIEFLHRVTSGLAFLLVIGMVIWAWRLYPRGHQIRQSVGFALLFMLIEVLVGAALVLLNLVADNISIQRAVMMTIHQANTFMLIGALTLTAWWASGYALIRVRDQGALTRWLGPALLCGVALGMTGAITALADTLFPSPSLQAGIAQDLDPNAHFLIQLRILHPIIALLVGGYLFFAIRAVRRQRPSPAVQMFSSILYIIFIVQIVVGALNIVWLTPLWSRLIHLLLADLIWITLMLLSASALARQEETAHVATSVPLGEPQVGRQLAR